MKRRVLKTLMWLLLLALLIPMPYGVDDGGSHGWAAALWRVQFCHRIAERDGVPGYEVGTEVTLLGFEIYSDYPRDFIPREQ